MKSLLLKLLLLCLTSNGHAQLDSKSVSDTNTCRFISINGGEIIGKLLNQYPRKILILNHR